MIKLNTHGVIESIANIGISILDILVKAFAKSGKYQNTRKGGQACKKKCIYVKRLKVKYITLIYNFSIPNCLISEFYGYDFTI